MTAIKRIQPEFVEYIPERLNPDILYISRRFSTAAHLCCCGCGSEVVTPLNPAKWRLIERGGKVSLTPSVGNWSLPCQSHYWISGNAVHFAPGMPPAVIAAVKARDRRDVKELETKQQTRIQWIALRLRHAWDAFRAKVSEWCR